ncbi:MAG: PilZ domain-containing protein [Phycisphaerae bacterium]
MDREGRVVLSRGQTVTESDINALQGEGVDELYAGPDWPDEGPPVAQVLAVAAGAAEAERPSAVGRVESRRHRRYPWPTQMRVLYEDVTPLGPRWEEMDVITLNISSGGFAFLSARLVHVGTRVWAVFETLPDRPCLVAVVRHCTYVSARKYHVGVQFTKE